jgi:hypothetical protein
MLPSIATWERELGDVRLGLKSFKPLRLDQMAVAVGVRLQDQ